MSLAGHPHSQVPYNLRFPGQYYDSETGLNQNWNRDYDPIVGRYVEPDPVGQLLYFKLTTSLVGRGLLPSTTTTGYWNKLYAYADDNPVTISDSTGQDAIWDFIAKALGQKAASAMQGSGISGALAAGCIADNCQRKVTNRSYMDAWGDCGHVLSNIKALAGGVQIIGDVDKFLDSCARTCSQALAKLTNCPECSRAAKQ